MLDVPVALLIFNRPEKTRRVFAEIARAKPRRLLVVADGPRGDNPEDARKCDAARSVIRDVRWKCEVLTDYSDVNLGCSLRIASGLTWVFGLCDEAIIIEDDCVPHPTFFPFCAELLKKYRDKDRIMMICGSNFQLGRRRGSYSYYFSSFHAQVWGWASWKRAWRQFDLKMAAWPRLRRTAWLKRIVPQHEAQRAWRKIFDKSFAGNIDDWSFQWNFACWRQNGLAVVPNCNLVTNIGFDDAATHPNGNGLLANLETSAIEFPLRHPPRVAPNIRADEFIWRLAGMY